MLVTREIVQKINATFVDAKINITKPETVLKTKIQEFVEELLPSQRSLLPVEVMEYFKALTGVNEDEENSELKTSDSMFVPTFKGIWKSTKEKLFYGGMGKNEFDALPLTFRSQEIFHLKKKGLIIEKSNDLVKLVKSDKEIVIRTKSANGTKSQGKATTSDFRDTNDGGLEYQLFATEKLIGDIEIELKLLENRKVFLAKQLKEEKVKTELEKELNGIKAVKEVKVVEAIASFYDQDFDELEKMIA